MQENDGQSVLPAYEHAQRLVRAGELAQARAEAQRALDAYGPHAGLYAVLGRAHAAEDEDDHDVEAERAYQAGLDAFPDDLDLLAGYAEFGLAGDVMEQPGRRARGQRAADRLTELAPGSPQALRVAEASERGGGPRPPSLAYVQRHDARAALNSGVALDVLARQAREAADAWPYDRRLAVRAETLAALAFPFGNRGIVASMLSAPYRTALVLCGVVSAWLLAVPALGLSWQYCLLGLVVGVPVRMERSLLRRARREAERRLPAGYAAPAPGAPDIPFPTRRERASMALAIVVVAAAVLGSVGWQYTRYAAYPRYVAVVPQSFHGVPLNEDLGGAMDAVISEMALPPGARTFSGSYQDQDSGGTIILVGATGDLHAEDPDVLFASLREGDSSLGGGPEDTWSAAAGPLGGRMECASYATGAADLGMCFWVDKGSIGMVMTGITGPRDHAVLARTARELRQATLAPSSGRGDA